MTEELQQLLLNIYERVKALEQELATKTETRYKISYDQSVSSGYIGFHGSLETNEATEAEGAELRAILQCQEKIFRDAGYKVATDIVPKEPKEKKPTT